MRKYLLASSLLFLLVFYFSPVFSQTIPVTGVVKDAITGETLPGVSVVVRGTTNGTKTDADGAFSLQATTGAILEISYIGYAITDIPAGSAPLLVSLKGKASELQQIVVVGYGTQRRVDVTGSVASVKGSDLAKQAAVDPVSALQGKVAGVQVTNNGQPGTPGTITIRGLGSYYGNLQPLFVVDGVWYNDISFLNNSDIENISILKDASSTAIYGIRAANGVVLITTKHGVKGKPVIDYNGYAGFQSVTNKVKMAGASQYATAVNELSAQYGSPAVFADPASLGAGTDWYKQILRSAFVTNHQVSVGGGTDTYRYNYSFGYLDQDGIVRDNTYQRYTLHASNDFTVTKNFKLGFSLNASHSESKDANGAIFHQLFGAAPTLPVFNKDGTYGDPNDYHTGDGNNYNPEATLDFFNQRTKNSRLTGNVYGEYSFLKHLKFRTSFGEDIGQIRVRNFTPIYTATLAQRSEVTNLDLNQTETRNWIWENTLTYDYQLKNHHFTALAGYSSQENRTFENDGHAQGVPYKSTGGLYGSFPDTTHATYYADPSRQLYTRAVSQFVRVNYAYKDRYLLNASLRRDGASQFYGKNTFGYFPSLGAGWVISNETFMQNQPVFDNLKLRASWGKVGNSQVPINPTVQVVSRDPSLTAIYGNPQQPYQGAGINTFTPPAIVWERAVATDLGLETSFLNNRLTFEGDYYNRTTQDAIFSIPILESAGATGSSIIGNQASIRNRGYEFLLSWKDQSAGKFHYTLSANLGVNNNKVLSVSTGANPIYDGGNGIANGAFATRTVAGQPIGEFYGYKVTGIFQTTAQVAASKQTTAQPGDFIYQDVNNDGVIDSRDRVVLGNPNPKYNYGINTAFSYNNFDLSLDFQGVAGVSIYNANLGYRYGNENFTEDFFTHRWHGAGTSTTYPSVNIGASSNSVPNSFFVSSGSYFRLRTAQLGYTFPVSLLSRYKIQKVRIFANAQNAINLFGYKGFSPEVGGTVGNIGLDANVYPLYATYNFGINLTF